MAQREKPAGGLRNVVVGESRISSIDGERGILAYGGIDIHALAESSTFEEVVFLLQQGALPRRAELKAFTEALAAERGVPPSLVRVLRDLPAGTHPMTALRTLVSALGALDPEAEDDGEAANAAKARRLTAQMGTLVPLIAPPPPPLTPPPPPPTPPHPPTSRSR